MIPSRLQIQSTTLIFVLLTIAVFLLISFSSGFLTGFFCAIISLCLEFAYIAFRDAGEVHPPNSQFPNSPPPHTPPY